MYCDLNNSFIFPNKRMPSPKRIRIRELDPEMIRPSLRQIHEIAKGSVKVAIIGKPGTGKTFLISSLLYEKSHIFPVGVVVSGTEDSNHHYARIFPSTFVHNKLDKKLTIVTDFVKRQKIAREHIENPWAVLLLDDCCDDPRIFNDPIFQNLFKNGRHFAMWFILSLQYAMDIKPVIRTNIDGTFILREPNLRNRHKLYENYAGIIPDFGLFCELMDQITDDYTALYIHNATTTNDWKDCVFWYKAKQTPKDFRFGAKEYYDFHNARYNPDYHDPVI